MKKLIIILVCLSLSPGVSFSQAQKNRLTLSFGPSFPVGNYGSASSTNAMSGFAKTGISSNVSYSHLLHDNFGLEVMLYGQQNGLNTGIMEQQLSESGFFYNPYDNSKRYYKNWTVPEKKWRLGSLLLGLSKELSAGRTSAFSITPKIMAGIVYAQLPSLKSESRMDTSYAVYMKSKLKGFGISFMAGADLNYQLNRSVGIHIGVDYFGTSKLKLKNVITSAAATDGGLIIPGLYDLRNSNGGLMAEYESEEKQTINSVNTKVGVKVYL